jgi:hypothetical protein
VEEPTANQSAPLATARLRLSLLSFLVSWPLSLPFPSSVCIQFRLSTSSIPRRLPASGLCHSFIALSSSSSHSFKSLWHVSGLFAVTLITFDLVVHRLPTITTTVIL